MKPGIVFVLLALALFSLSSVSALWSPDPYCSCRERDLYLTEPPMEGGDVFSLQLLLTQLDLLSGQPEGIFDERTERAVLKLQYLLDLRRDGTFTFSHWQEIHSQGKAVFYYTPPAMDPPPGEVVLLIDRDQGRLTVLSDGEDYKEYPVSVGRYPELTPVGEFIILEKLYHLGGGFGSRWMRLSVPWNGYGIHGTNNPGAIGYPASAGCIRLYNRDVEELFEWVESGTRVIITGEQEPVSVPQNLSMNSMGRDVIQLQKRLREAGFDAGLADGLYGEPTVKAVKELQGYYGLPQTGRADLNVLYLLGLR